MPLFRVRVPVFVEFDVTRADEPDVRSALAGTVIEGHLNARGGPDGFGCGSFLSVTTVDDGGITVRELDPKQERPIR